MELKDFQEELNVPKENLIVENQRLESLKVKLGNLGKGTRLHILDQLQANNFLQEIFLIKLHLANQEQEKCLEIVQRGNRILNRIIFAYKPFIFEKKNIDFFINELFPKISFNDRTKCIETLSSSIYSRDVERRIEEQVEEKNMKEGKFEQFFNVVLLTYGVRAASPLLINCSETFIQKMITEYRITLTQRQLVRMHKNHGPKPLILYFQKTSSEEPPDKKECFTKHPYVSKYLALNDICCYHELLEFGSPVISKKGFVNFVKTFKSQLIQNPLKYAKLTENREKKLRYLLTMDERKDLLYNALPETIEKVSKLSSYRSYVPYLDLFPRKDRGTILADHFLKKYNHEIWSFHKDYSTLDSYFEKMALEDIEKFNFDRDDKLREFLSPDYIFETTKEKINLTSYVNDRRYLILDLFKSASHNHDKEALYKALEYVLQRHKTDDPSIRQLVYFLLRTRHKIGNLDPKMWDLIDELIAVEEKQESSITYLYKMMPDRISYKFLNGKDPFGDLAKMVRGGVVFDTFEMPCDKELHRWYVLNLAECFRLAFPKGHDRELVYPNTFFTILNHWNRKYPNDTISYYDYPDILDQLLEDYDGDWARCDDMLGVIITSGRDKVPKEGDLLKKMHKFVRFEEFWVWLLKRRYSILEEENTQNMVFHKDSQVPNRFFYHLARTNSKLNDNLKRKAIDILRNDSEHSVKIALNCLSFQTDFFEHLDMDNLQEFASHLVVCMQNQPMTSPKLKYLTLFLQNDKGPSFVWHTFRNLPQEEVKLGLEILSTDGNLNQPLKLNLLELYDNQTSLTILKQFAKTIGQMEKCVFKKTFRHFCNCPSEESWNVLMDSFPGNNHVYNFNDVPQTYLKNYLKKVWQTYGEANCRKYLQSISKVKSRLEWEDDDLHEIFTFVVKHLKPDDDSEEMNFVFECLTSEKMDSCVELLHKSEENSKIGLFNFNNMLRKFLDEKISLDTRLRLANKLTGKLYGLGPKYLGCSIKLRIITYFLEDEPNLPRGLINLLKNICENNYRCLEYFASCASKAINVIYEDVEARIGFIRRLLLSEYGECDKVQIVGVCILHNVPCRGNELLGIVMDLIEVVEKNDNLLAMHYLSRYINCSRRLFRE